MEPETDQRMKLTGCHTLMLVAFPGLSGLVMMVARLGRPQPEGPNQWPPEGAHWLREKEGKEEIYSNKGGGFSNTFNPLFIQESGFLYIWRGAFWGSHSPRPV